MLLTSQIFDIKNDEMQDTRSSQFVGMRRNSRQTGADPAPSVSQSVHLQSKKVNLLHQALLVSQWVLNFDTKNIHDCFDNE